MKKSKPYVWFVGMLEFAAPGLVIIGASVLEVSDGGQDITRPEIITALVATALASTSAYRSSEQRQSDATSARGNDDDSPKGDT